MLIFVFALTISGANSPEAATLDVMDVGYGSAVHLRTDQGDYLFDVGPRESSSIVIEHLRAMGVKKIDGVFLSHTHPDHVGGLEPLSQRFSIDRVYWNGVAGHQPDVLRDLEILKGVTIFVLFRATETVDLGERLTATTVQTTVSEDDQNESSLVVFVRHPKWTLLFPGDAGPKRQKELSRQGLPLRTVRWMLWPHHGDQMEDKLIELMGNLRYAVVSVGANPYNMPAVDLESFSKKHRITVLRTDKDGPLRFHLDESIRR
ncbi:MAG: ComEC/Rec2 family competence protein [Elusimicrobiota bacterium]